LAVAKATNAKFDRGKWLELALLTNSTDAVQGHRRLLRSLDWGDEDYFGNVIEVVPGILGERSWTPSPLAGTAESNILDFRISCCGGGPSTLHREDFCWSGLDQRTW
jgi:hypothetical protein